MHHYPYRDLYALCRSRPEAKRLFALLSPAVQDQLRTRPNGVHTMEQLEANAGLSVRSNGKELSFMSKKDRTDFNRNPQRQTPPDRESQKPDPSRPKPDSTQAF